MFVSKREWNMGDLDSITEVHDSSLLDHLLFGFNRYKPLQHPNSWHIGTIGRSDSFSIEPCTLSKSSSCLVRVAGCGPAGR